MRFKMSVPIGVMLHCMIGCLSSCGWDAAIAPVTPVGAGVASEPDNEGESGQEGEPRAAGELWQAADFAPLIAPEVVEAAHKNLTHRPLWHGVEPGPDPVCRGGWVHTTFDCFKEGTGAVCGVQSTHGQDMVVDLDEYRENLFSEAARVSPWDWWWGVVEDYDAPEHVATVTRLCSEYWQQKRTEAGDGQAVVECYNLSRAPTSPRPKQKGAWVGRLAPSVQWQGNLRILRPGYAAGQRPPTYQICRHPDFGREASNVCGAPERPVLSEGGLRRSELQLEHVDARRDHEPAARCLTCDDLPERQEQEVAAKLHCLKENLRFVQELQEDADAGDELARAVGPHERLEGAIRQIRAQGAALFERVYGTTIVAQEF